MSLPCHVQRAGQTCWSRPYYGHSLAAGLGLLLRFRIGFSVVGAVFSHPVGHEPLQTHDIDSFIHFAARTDVLAPMITHAPANGRKRIIFLDGTVGVYVAPLTDQGDVALRALADGTFPSARSNSKFLYGIRVWNRLRIWFVYRLSFR